MRARRSRQDWAKLVEAFERSGQTLDRFCARRRVKPSTLKWWQWHLGKRRERAGGDVRLVPVDVIANAEAGTLGVVAIALAGAGAELRVEVGTDVAYVSALCAALRARC